MSDFDRMLGDSLKGIRNEHLKQIEAQVPAAREQIDMKLRRRRFSFVIGGVAVAAAAVAAIVFVAQTVPKVDRSAPIKPAGEPVVIARIDVPGVASMEPGIGQLWVSHQDGLSGIDPATGSIEIGSPGDGVDDMAAGSEALFTIDSTDRTLSRLPFGTDEAATSVGMEGTPTLVTASEEAVWVAAAAGPEGDSQILTYTPHLEMPGDSTVQLDQRVVADMLHAGDALWMTVSAGPNTAPEVRRFFDGGGESAQELSESEGSAADIVVGEGAVWVLRHPTRSGGNTITRIDLETDEMVERAVNFRESIESIAVGEGYLWVTTAPLGMDMPDDAKATLHRIDPATLEEVGEPLEVSGPGSKVRVGHGFVWVGDPNAKQIVQIDPHGSASPEPVPSTPEPDESSDETEPSPGCDRSLPFGSVDPAFTLSLGNGGGQRAIPLKDQVPGALVHFEFQAGRYVDVYAGVTPYPSGGEPVEVLGGSGRIRALGDGYLITFRFGDCNYQLASSGLNESDTKRFVARLLPRGDQRLGSDAFTIWPGEMPEAAYSTCLTAEGSQLADARRTALAFVDNALRWDNAQIDEGFIMNAKAGYEGYHVVRDGSEDSPGVVVMVREVAKDCWHVVSVGTLTQDVPDDAETGLSIRHRDGETTVAFDLAREAAGQPVESVRLIVAPGQVLLSSEEFERKGFIRLTDRPVGRPKALLVLLLDKNENIVGAIGQALPSGDFSAG